MDSALRPRDIQARIRGGESAEQVAVAAGTSVEQIMPYASPVLAERAHLAQTALRASVRRGTGPGGGARTLGQCVEQFLADHGLHDEDLAWDSWRRPDGKWALVAQFGLEGGEHTAQLVHDLPGRYVVADNDDARLLTGEATPSAPGAPAEAATVRRLSAVDDSLGADAIELVRDHDEPALDEPALDEPAFDEPAFDEPVDEATVEVPAGEEAVAEPPAEDPDHADHHADHPADLDETADPDEQPALDLGPEHEPPAGSGDEPAGADDEAAASEKRKRKGRASVPSWDEIMFGGSPRD